MKFDNQFILTAEKTNRQEVSKEKLTEDKSTA